MSIASWRSKSCACQHEKGIAGAGQVDDKLVKEASGGIDARVATDRNADNDGWQDRNVTARPVLLHGLVK
jgi:hypothetical protein